MQLNFREIDLVATNTKLLVQLKQTNSTAFYASKFQRLASHISWNDVALCHQFYLRLKNSVKDELIYYNRPTTLLSIIKLTVCLDNCIFERIREFTASSS